MFLLSKPMRPLPRLKLRKTKGLKRHSEVALVEGTRSIAASRYGETVAAQKEPTQQFLLYLVTST
ncbi:MAG: hypothetical protein HOP30_09060 [Cyclobacteriaceae bacterium]|nr:hypothetical protein [Cyclobacteriaceae bacterium]